MQLVLPCGRLSREGGGRHLPVELGFTSEQFICSFPAAALPGEGAVLRRGWLLHLNPQPGETRLCRGQVLPVLGAALEMELHRQ